jgi:hypothetical protein
VSLLQSQAGGRIQLDGNRHQQRLDHLLACPRAVDELLDSDALVSDVLNDDDQPESSSRRRKVLAS